MSDHNSTPIKIPDKNFPETMWKCPNHLSDYMPCGDCDEVVINECRLAIRQSMDDISCEHYGDSCRFLRPETSEESEKRKNEEAAKIVNKIATGSMSAMSSYLKYFIERLQILGFDVYKEHRQGTSWELDNMKVSDLNNDQKLTLIIDWLLDDDGVLNKDLADPTQEILAMFRTRDIMEEFDKRTKVGKIAFKCEFTEVE